LCTSRKISASQGSDLPAVGSEFAADGDRDYRASLSALFMETLPALVEPTLGAPGDVDHARVLALLTLRDVVRRPRDVSVLPSRLDEQPASVLGAGLGDSTLTALVA